MTSAPVGASYVGGVFQSDQARQLARRLHMLKARTNRSYDALSRRMGISSSTLHRYCRGEVVPPTYDIVVRFCKVCGATRQEAEELLRDWLLAVDHRPVPVPRPVDVRRRWVVPVVIAVGALGGVVWRRLRAGGVD